MRVCRFLISQGLITCRSATNKLSEVRADTPQLVVSILSWMKGMTMSDNVEEKWININEAAEYLSVKPATIRDWIRKGKNIPAQKVGKAWKFKYSELDAWAKSKESSK